MENSERICPNCGQPLSPDARFCSKCGQPCEIPQENAQAPATPAANPAPGSFPPSGDPAPADPTPGDPAPENPAQGDPMTGGPIPENPMQGNPMAGGPIPENPMQGSPMAGGPIPENPMQGSPMAGGPIPENPMQGNPMAGNPIPENPTQGNPMAGGPIPGNPMQGNPAQGAPMARVCPGCGTALQDGQWFCPSCGRRFDPSTTPYRTPTGYQPAYPPYPQPNNGKKKGSRILIAVGIALAIIGTGIFGLVYLIQGQVDSIVLDESSISINVDETQTVTYTITPEKAADKKVSWSSSDESIATVSQNGKITGQKEGTCIVTVKAGGKEDSMTVTVTDVPDLAKIYSDLGKPSYCRLAEDESYLFIDTNLNNRDDYMNWDAYNDLEKIIEMLDLPESLINEMGETRAIDGKQREEYDKITVTWTYHPDQGLEVTFKIK